MKILGISGSPRPNKISGSHTLLTTALEATGCEYELVSLKGSKILGCIACLRCVKDNVCKVEDDMQELREKVVAADAYIIGAPNYFSTISATTHAFLERWYQFRHVEGEDVTGKLGVAIGVGGKMGTLPAKEIAKFYTYNLIETVAMVSGQGAASCFDCGYGETCKVGSIYQMYGPGFKITEETTPNVTKQPDVMQAAKDAGELLGNRLREGNDRKETAKRVAKGIAEMLKSLS
ncbi:flavodoxin family protein [Thermodesulfobacteriota bacterium]